MNANEIYKVIAGDNDIRHIVWGLRKLPDDAPDVVAGDSLPNSHEWDDGECTDEELDGVCTIGLGALPYSDSPPIPLDRIEGALRMSKGYHSDRYVLVAGSHGYMGQDRGEVVISDAYAVATWM